MIEPVRLGWLAMMLQVKGSVIPAVAPRVCFCLGIAGCIWLLNAVGIPIGIDISDGWIPAILSVVNLVIGLLLVFRTNTAYERFWEGRKLWGELINTARNFARHLWVAIKEQVPEDRARKIKTLYLLVAYANCVKLHLRFKRPNQELRGLVDGDQFSILKTLHNPPLQVAMWITDYLQQEYKRHHLNIYQLNAMNTQVDTMVSVLGGCERILKTPIPAAYAIHLKQILFGYCLLLPMQLVDGMDWKMIPVVGLVSFILLGIEEIGVEIENPFGRDPNDLPLDAICATMLRNIEDLISLSSPAAMMQTQLTLTDDIANLGPDLQSTMGDEGLSPALLRDP
ncbi:MAG: bestrophin family ion channel [Synechococcales cyanobacterium]